MKVVGYLFPELDLPIPKEHAKKVKEAKRKADLERSKNAQLFSVIPNASFTLTGKNSPRFLNHLEEMENKVLLIEEDLANVTTEVPNFPKPILDDWSELIREQAYE